MAPAQAQAHTQGVASLVEDSATAILESLAPSTLKNYNKVLVQLREFIRSLGSDGSPIPANPGQIVLFITYLERQGFSASSVTSKLSSISFFHNLQGCSDPTKHFLVVKRLASLRKKSVSSDTRQPLTVNILENMLRLLPRLGFNAFLTSAFKAMLTVSFYGFLRPGEITQSPHNIGFLETNLLADKIEISMTHFKHYAGEPVVLQIQATKSPSCPVKQLSQFLKLRGHMDGPLFCHQSAKAFTYYEYNSMFKALKSFCGLEGNFSPHSARIGAATWAAERGVPEDQIRRMGRWHSGAFQKYIRLPTLTI